MKTSTDKCSMIHIGILEDDPLRLVGFQSILDRVPDFQVTGMTVAEVVASQDVHIALLGNRSRMRFLETMARLKELRPDLRVVVTGTGMDDETILKALEYGAKGYVDEAAPTPDLVQAIHTVHRGSVWIPRRVISLFVGRCVDLLSRNSRPSCSTITYREKQVLQMLVEGRSNKEIGGPLRIGERTVKAHVAKLMRKVGVKNRIALSVHAINHSLVQHVS
ncbi:MAG TPA: response regulator transcription factor [Terriglobales bacterium]|nr:response regulator transcription factor [Terriglobales bacterium]